VVLAIQTDTKPESITLQALLSGTEFKTFVGVLIAADHDIQDDEMIKRHV
jgi:hypothetical protein